MKKLLFYIFTFFYIFSYSQGTKCPLSNLANDLVGANDQFKSILNTNEGFDAYKILNIDAPNLRTNLDELKDVSNHLEDIKAIGGYSKWKSSINTLSAEDISKLRANSYAHTIERHGFEVTEELLKRRATEGIAPDGSSIAKRQGGQRIGNVIPPMSSKFKDATSMKKALSAVDESTDAFQNALRIEQASTSGQVQRFKFQVDLGDAIGLGYKRPAGAPNYVLTGQRLSGEPIKIDGLTKIEVRYKLNQSTNKFEINTMFPVE
ncbi:hypothetical protein [Tenacibaculum halocynthiae]|uniref:hypothetical protein n=1 Tax=Tenacibaculum halocynthiae TaxID=1254437 RepID=UPI0038940A45